MHIKPLNLSDIISSVAHLYSISAENKDINICVCCEPGIRISADRAMMETVLRNLVSNAIKFTHEGGNVSVTAKEVEDKVHIMVEDNGIGISAKKLDNLFEIDCKENSCGTNKEKGTGLGLMLCKEFIDKQEGKILVESRVGEGSIFTVIVSK